MMIRCSLAMLVFLLMPVSAVRCGDGDTDHLEGLRFLMGDWVCEFEAFSDVPELGLKKGMSVTHRNVFKSAVNGNAIELTMWRYCNDKLLSTNREVACWDPKRQVVAHTIYGDGLFGNGVWKQDGEYRVLDWAVTSADHEYKAHARLKSVGPDEYTWQLVDYSVDGKAQPDGKVLHFKRAPAPLSPGQEKMQTFAFLVGEWKSEFSDGKVTTQTYRWLNNQSFIEFRDGDYMEIMGWDPVNHRYLSWCYGTRGGIGLAVWQKNGDTWNVKCEPSFYDRYGTGIQSNVDMRIIDDDTLEVAGKFGRQEFTAKVTKVGATE